MTLFIPNSAEQHGFIIEGLGAHSGRTIMLSDFQALLAASPSNALTVEYRSLIMSANVLLKGTEASRKESFFRLRRLYSLDPDTLLFNILRELWEQSSEAQPILTLLYAIARDPILRATIGFLIDLPLGAIVTAPNFADIVGQEFPTELNKKTLASIGRNIASSYTQSGHLIGRSNKQRIRAESHATSVTYALLLGYLCGDRGEALFHTPWTRLLDLPVHEMHTKAQLASQQGWLEYRHAGQMTVISFNHLLQGLSNE